MNSKPDGNPWRWAETDLGNVEVFVILRAGVRICEGWFGERRLGQELYFDHFVRNIALGEYDKAAGWPISKMVPADYDRWKKAQEPDE